MNNISDLLCTLFLIILLGCCNGSQVFDAKLKQLLHPPSSSSSSSSFHIDGSMNLKDLIFFFPDHLNLGNKIPVHFPTEDFSDSSARFLSKEESDTIPFSSKHLPDLLRLFSVPQGSPQALAMKETLKMCEEEMPKPEIGMCATCMESMADFAQTMCGPYTPIQFLTTAHSLKSHALFQNYTVTGFKQIPTSKRVGCHPQPYPYMVYMCHHRVGEVMRPYKVWLTGEDGDKVDTVAMCHMDTSTWKPNHVSFRLLASKPGSNPICHFFVGDNIVWVPKASIGAM